MKKIKRLSFTELVEQNKQEITNNLELVRRIEEKIESKYQQQLNN